IMPLIIQYGLGDKLLNTKRLIKVLSNIGNKVTHFRPRELSAEELIQSLIEQFKNFAPDVLFEITKSSITEKVKTYCALLRSTVKNNNIQDPRTNALLETYPNADKNQLLHWMIALALSNDTFACQTLMGLLSSEKDKETIYQHLYEPSLKLIEQKKLTFA